MKRVVLVSLFSLSLMGSVASGSEFIGNDGCYQLYRPGSLYPVICVSGSAEEGIGGAGVRVVSVGPNSDAVSFCRTTVSFGLTEFAQGENHSTFEFSKTSAIQSIVFNGKVGADGREGGKVTITERGKAFTLDYLKLDSESARRLWKAFDSERCRPSGN